MPTERDVILEERRSRVENNPSSILGEQMPAALYQNHPYRIPVIGWMHEMAKLSREDALAFYKRFYAPNNAIVVVAGDVTVDEVKALAEATYGKLPPNAAVSRPRVRPQEPQQRAARRVELKDQRAAMPPCAATIWRRAIRRGRAGEAEALYPADEDRRPGRHQPALSEAWSSEEKVASSAGGWYSGTSSLDSGMHQRLRHRRRGRRSRQGGGRHRPRAARVAREAA